MQTKTTAHQYSPALPLLDRILVFLLCHKESIKLRHPHTYLPPQTRRECTLHSFCFFFPNFIHRFHFWCCAICFFPNPWNPTVFSPWYFGFKISLLLSLYIFIFSLCLSLSCIKQGTPNSFCPFHLLFLCGSTTQSRQLIKACTKLSRHCLIEILISSRPGCENLSGFKSFM